MHLGSSGTSDNLYILASRDTMKQRITYLLPQGSDLSVSDLQLENDSLRFAKAHQAAEEWRFTLGMDDLPIEVCSLTGSLSSQTGIYEC